MYYLDEFFEYKNRLMKDLLTSEEIVKLLDDDLPIDKAKSLAYKQVFPYEFVPDTIEHGDTFICFDVDITSVINKTYLKPALYVWEFTHKSKLRLDEGGVRTDKLASEIDKVLNGSRYYGMGELNLNSVRRFAPMTDYQGKVLYYQAREFNRTNPTGKPIPANRRDG